jgi:hypothetical protein
MMEEKCGENGSGGNMRLLRGSGEITKKGKEAEKDVSR